VTVRGGALWGDGVSTADPLPHHVYVITPRRRSAPAPT
jgi:hypothetical protein